jgi:alkanesulfonate monooxygenase SsuD/methylene tetrahydromethanopterin reductase-like flavin-dependent oxidoreductase (luciferase family)
MQVALFNLMNMNRRSDTTADILNATRDLTVLAEEIGLDAAWFAEHHFSSQAVCCSPLMMAAHCAAVTRSIRLGPAVLVLPFYNPLRVVQEIAMLDAMSGGRTILGFGAGHQPHEFRSFGIDIALRTDALIEAWDIIAQGLSTGRVAHDGAIYHVPPTELAIRPIEPRMPELFIASGDPALLRRAADWGATPFIAHGHRPLDAALKMRGAVETAFRAAGHDGALPLAVQRYIYLTEDRAEARLAAEGLLDVIRRTASLRAEEPPRDGAFLRSVPLPDEPSIEWLLEHALIGDPKRCADRLATECASLGTTHLSLYMAFAPVPPARVARSLELLGKHVLPVLRRARP